MVGQHSCGRRRRHVQCTRGFTLIELLVAIAVIGVAVTVFISFYTSGMDLTRTAHHRGVAAGLAADELDAILRAPQQYVWEVSEEPENAGLFRIRRTPDDPRVGESFAPPSAMPVDRAANERQSQFYNNFRWVAYGRLPEAGAAHYEVTVMVHWRQGNRTESVALTSSVPRFRVEGQA